jgi:serine/threonine protein kinase
MKEKLGKYRVLHPLVRGAFGQIYLGENIHSGTQSAIKVWEATTEEEIEGFLAEAHILARLVHPNIIRVLDFGIDDNVAFFVTTYAPYGSLRQHFTIGDSYPLSAILSSIKQMASALQFTHDQGIINCNVKPQHFLLDENSNVLLCDFGLAVVLQPPDLSVKLGLIRGTPAYMAPEQILGEVSSATDQYALGTIVYEWLCGNKPFEDNLQPMGVKEMMLKKLETAPLPLRNRVPNISPHIEQIVLRALSKDPQQRFPHIQDFADALEKAAIPPKNITIFFSYSHVDENRRDELAKRLAHLKWQGLISEWYDREIDAGEEWAEKIDAHLNTADIILLLVSPDFIASDYCYNIEMMKALRRHELGDAIVIPIILRPTFWQETPLGKLQALPKSGKAITTWQNEDEAFLDVADGIQRVVQRLIKR